MLDNNNSNNGSSSADNTQNSNSNGSPFSQGSSFVERFAKKSSNFSATAAKSSMPAPRAASADSGQSNKNSINSKIDPKKRAMADLIYLVNGNDRGRSAWYYVVVDRLKVQMFLKAMNSDSINLDDYGVVIYSAYGDNPPESITQKVKEEYGI